jgi:hypothetical protein
MQSFNLDLRGIRDISGELGLPIGPVPQAFSLYLRSYNRSYEDAGYLLKCTNTAFELTFFLPFITFHGPISKFLFSIPF